MGSQAKTTVPLRCLIVDDNRDFVVAAANLLKREGITVVGVALRGAEALQCVKALRPDVTLVDVDIGGESGFALTEQLHRAGQTDPSPVILISTHAEQDFAELIAASPAVGFLSKAALSATAIRDLLGRANEPQGT